ncbi:MAG: phosphopyruvate hydratase [Deltaproteobacteria bacterium]|nr:phosphopyruvate hydratase [Deltaproteobacteria bacterium]MCL5792338.1 phosphopyruvate hydratase [Deltaproteobacteria bacterium]
MKICDVSALEILDSRGNPTVEVMVKLESGVSAAAKVPSGASTGEREALELRDGDKKRYQGKGVLKVIDNIVKIIKPEITGMNAYDQINIDRKLIDLDGTETKSKLGANAILGVSLAVAQAVAKAMGIPLYKYIGGIDTYLMPVPMLNILNGGKHADTDVDFQEYMIVPAGISSFREAIRASVEVYHTLKSILKDASLVTSVGDEGGFAPDLKNNEEPLQFIVKAIEKAGYKPGKEIYLALDPASSEFYKDGKYILKDENKTLNSTKLIDLYESMVKAYPLISIEDGLAENDWNGWVEMKKRLGSKIQLVGDDITVTNTRYIKKLIELDGANSVLIKLNQIGTLTETMEAIRMVQSHGWTAVVSHRSGETDDTTISDLTVGKNTGFIKTGAPARGERVAKYNRLMEIEQELRGNASYAGMSAFVSIGR